MTRSPLHRLGLTRSTLVTIALLIAAGCSSATTTPTAAPAPEAAQTVVAGGTVIVVADTEPAGFNNRTAKGNTTAVRNIMRRVWPSVWTVTPNFETVLDPDFVVRAEVTNAAPQTIVYEIHKDARWSDKTPISADDFIYNWEVGKRGALDIDGSPISSVAPGESAIASITGSGDQGKTVTVVLKDPMAEWRSLFTKPLVPAHVAKRVGWNKGFDDWTAVVSGGPFRIGSYNAGRDLTLVRNEEYSGKRANLDSVTFNFVKDSSVALTEMKSNGPDSGGPPKVVSPRAQIDVLDQLRGASGITVQVGTGFEAEFLDFNMRAYPDEPGKGFLTDRRVRQAFALALDRKTIVARSAGRINKDAGVMQHRLLPAGAPYADTSPKGYDSRDVGKAKALLVEAGFVMPPGEGYFKKDGKTLLLRIVTASGDALRIAQAQLIQSQVKDAGIELEIDDAPNDNTEGGLSARLAAGKFDVASLSQGMATNPTTTSASFATPGTANISKYSNATVDDLYAKASSTLDEKPRVEFLNQIDRLLWEDMPRLPLYQRPTIVAFSNTLANVGINPVSGPFWNIDQWAMKATPRAR